MKPNLVPVDINLEEVYNSQETKYVLSREDLLELLALTGEDIDAKVLIEVEEDCSYHPEDGWSDKFFTGLRFYIQKPNIK